MKNWTSHNLLKTITIILILGALLSPFNQSFILPFAYYQIMNWSVTIAALMTAWQAYQKKNMWIVWIFSFTAIIFNPITPIYLSAQIWQISDLIVAILFIVSFFLINNEKVAKLKFKK